MSESGLSELLVGCDLFGANAVGKVYAHATRTRKPTLQALWQYFFRGSMHTLMGLMLR